MWCIALCRRDFAPLQKFITENNINGKNLTSNVNDFVLQIMGKMELKEDRTLLLVNIERLKLCLLDIPNLCGNCCEREGRWLIMPCAHSGLCETCATLFKKKKQCGICKALVQSIYKSYNVAIES